MQFRTAGKETLDLKIMKEKIVGILVIIKNKLEIKKIRENFGVSYLHIIYTDEKFSFNALSLKRRRAFVHENVFITVEKV